MQHMEITPIMEITFSIFKYVERDDTVMQIKIIEFDVNLVYKLLK